MLLDRDSDTKKLPRTYNLRTRAHLPVLDSIGLPPLHERAPTRLPFALGHPRSSCQLVVQPVDRRVRSADVVGYDVGVVVPGLFLRQPGRVCSLFAKLVPKDGDTDLTASDGL